MPNKNVFIKKKTKSKKEERSFFAKLFSQFKMGDSFTNVILGAIVIIIIAITLIVFVKNNRQEQTSSTTSDSATEEKSENATPSTYTIKVGDSLWSISEKIYKSGYNWKEIAKANNLENPGLIHAGNTLKLPKIDKEVVVDTKSDVKGANDDKTIESNSITENKYTVKRGDNLWNIAVRAYGDGFRYVEIAKANNLVHPSLIHSDNVLIIPRV